MEKSVRFGVLGAARIAPAAVVGPASKLDRCSVVAVAARDAQRAARFASKHAIARSTASYDELVGLEDINAVYIGLPASLHAQWSMAALRAGKHVLCEKPFTTSAEEAEQIVTLASERGLVLCEAFHYAYHPLAKRMREICTSGAIGELQALEGRFYAPIGDTQDIRYDLALGGGATMDLGCYPIHWMRSVTGMEPDVISAKATERPPGVDEVMTAELRFPGGIHAQIDCSMTKEGGFSVYLDIRGSEGALHVTNLIAPGLGYELKWHNAAGEFDETVEADGSTFDYQMREFVAAVLDEKPMPTGGQDAIENMRVIDAVYRAAGLPPRRI
jgi:predicted dehydrogenase